MEYGTKLIISFEINDGYKISGVYGQVITVYDSYAEDQWVEVPKLLHILRWQNMPVNGKSSNSFLGWHESEGFVFILAIFITVNNCCFPFIILFQRALC